uniref:GPN-loop GTPase 2 n=1 Tax=Gongylonema pulchrum TaxID=637853 RepID=A0A183E119_9BILA
LHFFRNIFFFKDLIALFKSRGHVQCTGDDGGAAGQQRPVVVGMVGYPNLVLCDCPGLVMPSFALSRNEMILNGILSVDHMHDYFSPVALLLTRIPRECFEKTYSLMLTGIADSCDSEETPISAHDLLTAVAFMRGYMSSSGVADCSRAARLILKDVVTGKLKWVAAPPDVDQKEFDKLTYGEITETAKTHTSSGLEKRHLLEDMKISDSSLDQQFFGGTSNQAHIRSVRTGAKLNPTEAHLSKKHFNKGKKEKLRRIYDNQV